MSELMETLWTDAAGEAIIHGCTKPWPNDIKWVRADLPPTLSAAMELPEVKALVKAARPFYAAVFNDNGDVTISTGHITTGDWLALDTALAAIKEQKT